VAAPATHSASAQFPPLLSIEEWKTLFSKLNTSFDELEERIRYRAYELYEQRGNPHHVCHVSLCPFPNGDGCAEQEE